MNSKVVMIKLVNEFKNDELVLEMIRETLNSCSMYVHVINRQEITVSVEKYVLPRNELNDKIDNLDNLRKLTHDSIISGFKAINRLCIKCNLEKFYKGNEDDRVEVAEFAMEIVKSSFDNRKR